jgi:hypothetical protein
MNEWATYRTSTQLRKSASKACSEAVINLTIGELHYITHAGNLVTLKVTTQP